MAADHYVAALPVERLLMLLSPALRAAEPRLERARPARRALDERRDVLPRPRRAAAARPRDLHRLRVGADGDLAGAVLARRRPRAARRRPRRGHPLRRRVGVGAARPADRQGRDGVHARRRSAPRSGASSPTTSTTARCDEGNVRGVVPGPGDRVPESDCGHQPRAAADQHGRLVGGPAGRGDADPNLFLAADFVRTHTDLATMEGANEAARRAVNGILAATGSARRAAGCGSCASRACSRRSGRSTGCAGGSAAGPCGCRPGAGGDRAGRAGVARAASSDRDHPVARALTRRSRRAA